MFLEQVDPLTEFLDGIKSKSTRSRYVPRFDLFLRTIGMEGRNTRERAKNFALKARDTDWAYNTINQYMRMQRERAEKGEISESTVPNYFKPIKLFCDMNRITLPWKNIQKRIPQGRAYAENELLTKDQLRQLLTYPDRRIKVAVLTNVSSGIRVGSWDYLNWGDIKPILKDGVIVSASFRAYDTKRKTYYPAYLTPEAYTCIKDYIEYRKKNGERITPKSPVLRNLFVPDKGAKGEPHNPIRLKSTGVKRLIEDALKGTGLRKVLPKGTRRHPFQANHGFRKYFSTVCFTRMKAIHATMIQGHSLGVNDSYVTPSTNELLEEYLKAVPDLTILEQLPGQPSEEDVDEMKEKIKLQGEEVIKLHGEIAERNKQMQGRIDKLESANKKQEEKSATFEKLLDKIDVIKLIADGERAMFQGKEREVQEMQDLREKATGLKSKSEREKPAKRA